MKMRRLFHTGTALGGKKYMEELCNILDKITNPLIITVAAIELVIMFKSLFIMINFRKRIDGLNGKEYKKSIIAKKEEKRKVKKIIELESNHDWEEFDGFLEDYQRQGCWYSAFSLIIQIFTLLGILGTVAGLYLAMKNGQDMYHGVELALSTTILGIMCAVIYKTIDIIIVSVFINYIEDGINRYEKVYNVDNEDASIAVSSGNDNDSDMSQEDWIYK